ncbi:MAG TPA: glycosyltransferase [Solirubrobacteraceae bacterium]|nr:glycosyltransferase [Solirubrobacteraceae bacterium]
MPDPDVLEPGGSSLFARLDVPLPTEIAVGAGTAVFVCGWCFAPLAGIAALSFELDGASHPVMAFGMPRLDPFAELHPGIDPYDTAGLTGDPASAEDPELRSYRSGFWGLIPVTAPAPGRRLAVGLRAQLDTGSTAHASLGTIAVAPLPAPKPAAHLPEGEAPLVAICMATHNPPQELLEGQLESIRAQTHRRWICLISDDGSDAEHFALLQQAVAGDERFQVSRAPRRLGFYRNFERALALVPRAADYVALSDQDDRWHPDKLATLLQAIGDARLAYSDCRVVARDGELISETYWNARDNNHTDMLSLLVANSVSGAAILLRRDLLDDALPFPPAQFAHYHDHWLGLVALALGEVRFVDRPLYDYVQHGNAALGHAAANRMPSLASRLRRRDRRESVRLWRMHYFVDVCRLRQCIAILRLRCEGRITAPARRALDRFERADRSWSALGLLGYRGVRELTGRRTETLGAEWMLFWALMWRRLVAATARPRPQRRLRLDAVPPSDLAPRPAREAAIAPAARAVEAKIAPLALDPSPAAPVRVNLLIPTIDLDHFFGGYIAKFNLAHRLVAAGLRVRVVTVDPVGGLPRSWRRTIEAYSGLDGVFDRLEVVFGREQAPLEVNPRDGFIATTWWTAHIAQAAMRTLAESSAGGPDERRFLYLIQEYEPFTFPMGTYAALAQESYAAGPHFGLFSSELLREYFHRHAIGVFADGQDGDASSASFQNAITAVPPPEAHDLAARRSRRLLFYARPEPHAARNLFELGVLALGRALERGTLPADWELNGIGSLAAQTSVALGEGAALRLLPRTGQDAYAQLLRDHDVGLALMYTPHPSLVPIEMASAGMLTVTNTFENKTSEALAAISDNLLAGPPAIDAIAEAIGQAVAGAGDAERRVRGSAVAWSRDWDSSFDEALVQRLIAALGWGGA